MNRAQLSSELQDRGVQVSTDTNLGIKRKMVADWRDQDLEQMTAEELRAFAEANGIEISASVSKKETLIKKIREAQ